MAASSAAAAAGSSAHVAAASSTVAVAAVPAPAPASAAASAAASGPGRPMLAYSTRRVTQFEKLNLLGEGTYGSVYRALDKVSGELVALKKIRPERSSTGVGTGVGGSGFPLTSVREVRLLQSVHHPHIIRLREVSVGRRPESIFLVFDYCPHDLATLVDRMTRPFSEAETKRLMLQLLDATDYLHRNFIVHRDLKLSNLLIDQQGRLQLADFGLARTFTHPLQNMTPKVVTLWYRAPELLLGTDKYHSAVDMWAVGCIFGELLRHRPLLPGKSETSQLSLICSLLGTPNEKIWPGFGVLAATAAEGVSLPHQPYNNLSHEFPQLSEAGLDLLSRLLTYDPSKRLTAEKALAHPYFTQHPQPTPEEQMPTFAPQQHPPSASIAPPPSTATLPPLPLPPPPVVMQTSDGAASKKRKPGEGEPQDEAAEPKRAKI